MVSEEIIHKLELRQKEKRERLGTDNIYNIRITDTLANNIIEKLTELETIKQAAKDFMTKGQDSVLGIGIPPETMSDYQNLQQLINQEYIEI